jgi:hypothetical protein
MVLHLNQTFNQQVRIFVLFTVNECNLIHCVQLDMGQTSWKKDPTPLVALLKSIVRSQIESRKRSNVASSSSSAKKTFVNDDELLSSLKTPVKPMTRYDPNNYNLKDLLKAKANSSNSSLDWNFSTSLFL